MFGDDKRLKKLIILVLFSSSHEEDSSIGHAARHASELLLTHDQAAKVEPLGMALKALDPPGPSTSIFSNSSATTMS